MLPTALARKLLPRKVKEPIKAAIRARKLSSCIHKLKGFSGRVPPRDLVHELREAWGNTGFSADVDYLLEAVRLSQTCKGQILECGSGLSTVLLASLGIRIYSLEHDLAWILDCRAFLKKHHLEAELVEAPITKYEGFSWYAPSLSVKDIDLVLCDGPPGNTPGGRYGLLPVLRHNFSSSYTILMDDAERPEDADIAKRWHSEFGLQLEFLPNGSGTLAVLRKGIPATEAPKEKPKAPGA
jgi:hypothetical protein